MSDQIGPGYGPAEQADAWLRRQIAAAAGPRDVGEMSDAQLENMLDFYRDETYTPDQMERLLARFWIEVSQVPSTESHPEPTADEPRESLPLGAISDTAAGSQHAPASTAVVAVARQATVWQKTASFFSEYAAILCLAVTVVMGLVLAWHWPMSRRVEVTVGGSTADARSDAEPADVGRISGAVDCSFAGGVQPVEHERVKVGQQLKLDRGLLEITYDAGVEVILQGPATYTVESAQGGFLAVGKLTALVESGRPVSNSKSKVSSPRFALRTPSLTVNDLGTEFGVEVKPNRVTEVCVFRGQVDAAKESRAGFAPVRERLAAGEALRLVSRDAPLQRMTVESLGAAPLPSPGRLLPAMRAARDSQLLAPSGLVATAYHRVWDAHGNLSELGDRWQAFEVANDGIFGRGQNDEGPRSSFDTLSAEDTQTDFVGLTYDRRVRIDRVKVFLGHQFGDGGNWKEPPRVFILVNPVDSGSMPPESNPADWRELPTPQVSYGTPFDAKADANPGEVMEFVLTGYPAEHRTGYGWAIGGVDGNGSARYVSITELRGYGVELEKQ